MSRKALHIEKNIMIKNLEVAYQLKAAEVDILIADISNQDKVRSVQEVVTHFI